MRTCEQCGFDGNRDTARFCVRCGQTLSSQALLSEGTVLRGRYRVTRVLGKGGMGAVYLVEDLTLYGKYWAAKELLEHFSDASERAAAIAQFQREVQILVNLRHPNLPQVVDFFEEGGRHYLVMEFIEGQTLKEMLAAAPDGCLPEEQVLNWAGQICDVLDYLHRHDPPVIFRDLKPANVMITPQGQVKLIDFGVARLFDPAKGTDTLKMGTVGYAPPEQYAGQGQTTPRSDVYALGATVYELLTGDSPEAHPFVFSTVRRLRRGISPRTAQAIARAVQLDPNARFPSARALKAALQRPRRRPPAALFATLPLVLLLAGGGWWMWRSVSQGTPVPSPTSLGLAVAQVTPSPTPTRRPTVTLAPTYTPSPAPTDTPIPTLTASPTLTLSPTPLPTPTRSGSPTPTSTPAAAPASGALITFEQFGSWRRGDQPNGELTQTQEQIHSGNYAAKLRYNFPAGGDDFVVFIHPLSLGGNPNTIGAWVYGDGSAHFLNVWIEDAQGEIWSVALGQVGAAGWRQMVGLVDANLPWPSGHISGPDNRAIDYPIRFYALVLDRVSGAQTGQVYIDDISAWRAAGVATSTPAGSKITPVAASPTSAPAPPGQLGRILYTVDAGSGSYYLASTDPTWSQGQVLDPVSRPNSSCSNSGIATTLTGRSFNLFYGYRCGVVPPVTECTSPTRAYTIVIWESQGTYSLSVYRTSDNAQVQAIYAGPLNTQEPLLWAPDGSRFYFMIDRTLHQASPYSAGYQPVLPIAYEPYLSPDGSMLVYLQPVGTVGAYDVWVANADGSNARNVTNAPGTYKLCARWGGY